MNADFNCEHRSRSPGFKSEIVSTKIERFYYQDP